MKLIFPYGEKEGRQYPLVDITLSHQKNSLTIRALIDSGATFSVFRPEIADFLKIQIEKGQKMYLEGVGGRILGRDNFFSEFLITFDEENGYTTLEG